SLARIEHPMAVRVINHIIEIPQPLLPHEVTQDIHVAIGFGVSSENIMVGDDDHFCRVPNLGVLAELTLENPDRPRPADIMRHEDVGIDPDVIACGYLSLAGGARQ